MGVQGTIDAYLVLASKVFRESPILPSVVGSHAIVALLGNARFSGHALTDAIQAIVAEQTKSMYG